MESAAAADAAGADVAALEGLFARFDAGGSGFLERSALRGACGGLTDAEFEAVFAELDADGDGRVSRDEFLRGFTHATNTHLKPQTEGEGTTSQGEIVTPSKWRQNADDARESRECLEKAPSVTWEEFVDEIGRDFYELPAESQAQVRELYSRLVGTDSALLLRQFEDVVLTMVRQVRLQTAENLRLETSYKREKERHERHLRQLEEEMEGQVQRAEQRSAEEQQERFEQEKSELKAQLTQEIAHLQESLSLLQTEASSGAGRGESLELRSRLDDLCHTNRSLQSSLCDAHTSLAVLRAELATLRQNYADKCRDLQMERETLREYIQEQESLTQQLHVLHDANKKLHDTNDDLLEASEYRSPSRILSLTPSREPRFLPSPLLHYYYPPLPVSLDQQLRSRSQYVEDYIRASSVHASPSQRGSSGSLAEELREHNCSSGGGVHSCSSGRGVTSFSAGGGLHSCSSGGVVHSCSSRIGYREERRLQHSPLLPARLSPLPVQHSVEGDDNAEDGDSGHSTLQGVAEDPSSSPCRSDCSPGRRSPSLQCTSSPANPVYRGCGGGLERDYSFDDLSEIAELTPEADALQDAEEELDRIRPNLNRPGSSCSFSSRGSVQSRASSRASRQSLRRHLAKLPPRGKTLNLLLTVQGLSAAPERLYKVVLCGDAAVGKSSFILRLCKNVFIRNLQSTLGVDFQTRAVEVDGRLIALQLWDTAGQERFRSIAKSYFRRADGVLLLYDCTYERSFLGVRDWMDAIEEGAGRQLPVMLVANKTDLREQPPEGVRCVSTEEGQRLARSYDALFIETSAKEGSNITEAATEFARLLKSNEDLEVRTVGMKLHELKSSKNRFLPDKCC